MGTIVEAMVQPLTADTLKARFKQLSQQTNNVHQNWQIRVHRSISWLRRGGEQADLTEGRFLFLWIALNSLYSLWDAERNMPGLDADARERFLRRVCEWDKPLTMQLLQKHRGLVKKLLENPYLATSFWRDPENPKAKGWATQDANYLDRNLRAGDAQRLLQQTLDRLFVFRGQLVHGASTGGSKLNRTTLKYCLATLELLVPRVIHVVIEHGCHDDWPDLCYPPIKG